MLVMDEPLTLPPIDSRHVSEQDYFMAGRRPGMRLIRRRPGKASGPNAVATFRRFGIVSAAENLQLPLIPLDLGWPVTPKVAGSSPVAPAILFKGLARVGYFGCNFLTEPSCNSLSRFRSRPACRASSTSRTEAISTGT